MILASGNSRLLATATWATLVLAATAIVFAARGDLWLDEVWSLWLAREAGSVFDILFRTRHDNNHVLNTLFLFAVDEWVGSDAPLIAYRLLSVACGFASLFLFRHLALRRWGQLEALLAVLFAGACYPLLLYFSEARGYAGTILCGLIAYVLLPTDVTENRPRALLGFWLASICGVLFHATFAILSTSFALGSLAGAAKKRPRRAALWRACRWHLPPLAFLSCWYLIVLHDQEVGGGHEPGVPALIAHSAVYLLGLPETSLWMRLSAAFAVGATIVLGLVKLRKESGADTVLFLSVLFLMPAALLLILQPKVLYLRYFAICFPFFLLLATRLAAEGLRDQRLRFPVALLVFCVFAGHLRRDHQLMEVGRGSYASALSFIVERSDGDTTTVGSSHDFGFHRLIDFYMPRVAGTDRLRYVDQTDWPSSPPDWIILSAADRHFSSNFVSIAQGGRYALRTEIPTASLSGWPQLLLEREF
jgi:hypothetical protein